MFGTGSDRFPPNKTVAKPPVPEKLHRHMTGQVVRYRRFTFLLAAVLASAGFVLSARAELNEKQRSLLASITRDRVTSRWTDLDTNQLSVLRARADAYLADARKHHLPGGLVASARFANTSRTEVVQYEALDHSAAWTGLHLTALAFRYAVTRDLRTIDDIRRSLDGVERLISVSGRDGFLPCFAGRADDPAYRRYYAAYGGADPQRDGFGRAAHAGEGRNAELVWLGNTSRDNYAGLNLGLGTVHQFIRDPQVRTQVALIANRILDRLIADGWKIRDGRSPDTFVTPILATALLRTGATVTPAKYQGLYDERVKDPRLLQDLSTPGICRYCDYAPNVFSYANLLSLTRLETNQSRRLVYQSKCTDLWRDSSPHLNAWFAAAHVAAFDSVLDPVVRATLQGQLYQFPAPPRWARTKGTPSTGGAAAIAANGTTWSALALPLDQQPVAAFQWMQSPYAIASASDEPVAHPGIDFYLPFWIGREGGIIPSEDEPPRLQSTFKPAYLPRARTNAPSTTNGPALKR